MATRKNINLLKIVKCVCLWTIAMMIPVAARSQVVNINRPLDYVVIEGQQFLEWLNLPHHQIKAYRYNMVTNTWTMIPFQVDDWDQDEETLAGTQNNILDAADQLVFQASDLGDRANTRRWISNTESRNFLRHEIAVTNPQDNSMGWVYLFYSPTITGEPASSISYDPGRDSVTTTHFVMGHKDENGKSWANGFPMELKILPAIGGNGVDIFDRYKLRLYAKAEYDIGITTIRVEAILYEDSTKVTIIDAGIAGRVEIRMEKKGVRYGNIGPVRLIRDLIMQITTKGTLLNEPVDDSTDFSFSTQFFAKHFEFSSGRDLEIPTDFGDPNLKVNVQYFRLSADLNPAANGMAYFDEYNNETTTTGRKIIDGNKETSFNSGTFAWPGIRWYTITGSQGSIFTQFEAFSEKVANGGPRPFFYDDRNNPGWPNTYPPGVLPSGDRQSWGDNGFSLNADNENTGITGPVGFTVRHYYLAPGLSLAQSRAYVEQFKNPLQVTTRPQVFDSPPALITSLEAVNQMDTGVTLRWIAPTENQNSGGACDHYVIGYSHEPPFGDGNAWWYTVVERYITIGNPAEPGTVEEFVINGLSRLTDYWFGIRAYDASGQFSGPANDYIVGSRTTPVELASFNSRTNKNTVTLNWSTAAETNNYGFEIDRISPNSSNWRQVGFVSGHGTTNQPQAYRFNDRVAEVGEYRYRLKQVDADGTFSYSKEIIVRVAGPADFYLDQNYPNPFNPTTTIRYEVPETNGTGKNINLTIFDLLGRQVLTLITGPVEAGYHEIQWHGTDDTGSQVASGVYFYILTANNFRSVKKMIKIQ